MTEHESEIERLTKELGELDNVAKIMISAMNNLIDERDQLRTVLRKCHTALEVAFDYDGDDVFGMMHNDAVDASIEAERLLGIKS